MQRRHIRQWIVFAIILQAISLISLAFQWHIVRIYVKSARSNNWAEFSRFLGVHENPTGPGTYCIDACAPNIPYVLVWLSVFASCVVLIFLCIGLRLSK